MNCSFCNTQLDKNKKFCNRSCAASYNNRGVRRHGNPKSKCKHCKRKTKGHMQLFCSVECFSDYKWSNTKELILQEKEVSWRSIRKYLLETKKECQECGISEWNFKPITLECDHIDGNKSNNILSNARLLCPNCHSQTETYKAKNTNNPLGKEERKRRYYRDFKINGPDDGIRTHIFNSITDNSLED